MNDFEQFLKQQPPRSLPPQWCTGILEAARASRQKHAEPAGATSAPVSAHPWWLAWLWPSPTAWVGVDCMWVVILGLNAASKPEGSETFTTSCSSADFMAILTAQQRQLDELFRCQSDAIEPPDAIFRRAKPGAFVRQTVQTLTA